MNIYIFQVIFYWLRCMYPAMKVTAKFPLAQALIESAKWTSPLYEATNNMFGMQHPHARRTTSLGPNPKGFATYRSPLDSIRDYFLYLQAFEVTADPQLFARYESGKYATDPNYSKKVLATVAGIQNDLISPTALVGTTVVAAAAAIATVSVVKKAVS